MVLVLLVVVVLVVTLTGSKAAEDAESVQDVADLAVAAAEELDVDKGVDLLCEAPSSSRIDELEDLIEAGQEAAGTDDPDVDYVVSGLEGDAEGSFIVKVSSDEEGLEDSEESLRFEVSTDGSRSCIADISGAGDE